jgi:pimeloyl-ACP methyl ester carboxylesterase
MKRLSPTVPLLLLVAFVAVSCNAQTSTKNKILSEYPGNYRTAGNHIIGIDQYITEDTHENRLIYTDYLTGVVRLMSPSSESEFSIGPGFSIPSPVELKIRFIKNGDGAVTGLAAAHVSESEALAERIPLIQENVTFQSGTLTMAGTLLTPTTPGPHPAIILLHGSGALTRYSFGPYPHFFTSLGFAVLIYDKRGAGESEGESLDRGAYYPSGFVQDALAAFNFLQNTKNINPKGIGFWGSSEGGTLTTQVAALNRGVAFIVNSSGFMMPLWEQGLYHIKAAMRDEGFSKSDIDEAVAYDKLLINVGRTGHGWKQFQKAQDEVRTHKWFSGYSIYIPSLDQLRSRWTHILSFSPLPALGNVRCPVLGLFGEIDDETPANIAVSNMKRGLRKAGNHDYTLKIFPSADHALMLGRKTMAPGVFQTLSVWLSQGLLATN